MPNGAVIYEASCDGAFRQAEIVCGVKQLKRPISADTAQTPISIDLVNHPFAIVVSQDCDLDLDFRARNGLTGPDGKIVGPEKKIPNILLCEVVKAEGLRGSVEINAPIWSRVKTNNDVRYHFFQAAEAEFDALGTGLPELAVDFKRYFTIMAEDLYAQLLEPANENFGPIHRRLRLKTPYCEHFCTRFVFYLSRIAVPVPHFSVSG